MFHCFKILMRFAHGIPHIFTNIPDTERYVTFIAFTEHDGSRLSSFTCQMFSYGKLCRVIAASYKRVAFLALVAFVVAVNFQMISYNLREERLHCLILPHCWGQYNNKPVAEILRLVDPIFIYYREEPDLLQQIFPQHIVYCSNAPARRHQTAVFLKAESADAQGFLQARDCQAFFVQRNDCVS